MPGDLSWMEDRYKQLSQESFTLGAPTLESPNEPRCTMDGTPTIMLSSNNYLNLPHPKVVSAMVEATKNMVQEVVAFVQLLAQWTSILQLRKSSRIQKVESALIYSAGYILQMSGLYQHWFPVHKTS